MNNIPPCASVTNPGFGSGTPTSAKSLLLPWYIGSCTEPNKGFVISLGSHLNVVPSTSTNFDSSSNGVKDSLLASSNAILAAVVLPTPGGPYKIICCGYGDESFDINDLIALSWPTTSLKFSGLRKLIIFLFVFFSSKWINSSYFLLVLEFSLPFCFLITDKRTSSIYFSCLSIIFFSTLASIWLWTYLRANSSEIQSTVFSIVLSTSSSDGIVSLPFPSEAIITNAYALSHTFGELTYFCNLYFTVLALTAPWSKTLFKISNNTLIWASWVKSPFNTSFKKSTSSWNFNITPPYCCGTIITFIFVVTSGYNLTSIV